MQVCTFLDEDAGKYVVSNGVPKVQVACIPNLLGSAKSEGADSYFKLADFNMKKVSHLYYY